MIFILKSRLLLNDLFLRTSSVHSMIPSYLQNRISMYVKVKVRQQDEEEDPPEFQRIYLKDFQSNHQSNSPQHKHGYTPPLVRVPESQTSGSDTKISARTGKVAEENKVNRKVAEVNKPSSVLAPRAVLSSPENDAMLGIKNKTKTERSGLKNHKSSQNTHVKCKKSYELQKKSSSWKP